MSSGRPSIDLRAPPADLDRLIEWFDAFSQRLVLLEEYSVDEIRGALGAVSGPVLGHCRAGSLPDERRIRSVPGAPELLRLLRSDHERFRTSVQQLGWFYSVVARENHGGHRQALGQYGRAFAESFRRHRAEERALERRVSGAPPSPDPRPASGKGY